MYAGHCYKRNDWSPLSHLPWFSFLEDTCVFHQSLTEAAQFSAITSCIMVNPWICKYFYIGTVLIRWADPVGRPEGPWPTHLDQGDFVFGNERNYNWRSTPWRLRTSPLQIGSLPFDLRGCVGVHIIVSWPLVVPLNIFVTFPQIYLKAYISWKADDRNDQFSWNMYIGLRG